MTLDIVWVYRDFLRPNDWNPNEMTPEMMAKERASIRRFGLIDPITSLPPDDDGIYTIIDGEQRFTAGKLEGLADFPVVILDVTEDEAKELTIVLNDTRGRFREDRLSTLVQDIAKRRERSELEELLPYDRGRLDQLLGRREIDWGELEKRRGQMRDGDDTEDDDPFVERVFRMPRSSAAVVDEAIAKVRSEEDLDQPWRALEMIAADYLAG